MSYYHICSRNIGRGVRFTTVDGRHHRGIITRVTPTHLYYNPIGAGISAEEKGEAGQNAVDMAGSKHAAEIQWWGFRRGFGFGFGTGVALGAITSLAFLPFFFW